MLMLKTGGGVDCRGVTAPAMTSLCPARYLVAEWMTMSAPRDMARWLMGVAKVESMHTSAPAAWHSREMVGTSTQRRYGFVGDSEKNRLTFCAFSARSSPCKCHGKCDASSMICAPSRYWWINRVDADVSVRVHEVNECQGMHSRSGWKQAEAFPTEGLTDGVWKVVHIRTIHTSMSEGSMTVALMPIFGSTV